MSCSCSNTSNYSYVPCGCQPINCTATCTSIYPSTSWNIPICSANAVLTVPGLKNVLIGAYIWNPTYGYFLISSFDAYTSQLTITNTCLSDNAIPGTTVPALTGFAITSIPSPTTDYETWAPTLTASGSMTVTGQTIDIAEYFILGSTFFFNFQARFTLGGTTSTFVYIPLPGSITLVPDSTDVGFICAAGENSSGVTDPRWRVEATRLVAYKYTVNNWVLGAGGLVAIQGRAQIA